MLLKWFQRFLREKRHWKAWSKAYDLAHDGKHAEAAGAFAGLATQMLQAGEIHYHTTYCHDAFQEWIKAKNPEYALHEARKGLRALSDACRLSGPDKYSLQNSVEQLSTMVGELYMAGYAAEADKFLREVNECLAANGLPHILASGDSKFPTACPQCGGSLSLLRGDERVPCAYCGSVIRAV